MLSLCEFLLSYSIIFSSLVLGHVIDNIMDSRAILRMDTWGSMQGDYTMAPSRVFLQDPCYSYGTHCKSALGRLPEGSYQKLCMLGTEP